MLSSTVARRYGTNTNVPGSSVALKKRERKKIVK